MAESNVKAFDARVSARRPVFSDFTNSGLWRPAYEAQNEAMDEHMEKYNLQEEDWRPGMFRLMERNQKLLE